MEKRELMNMLVANGYRVFESRNKRDGAKYEWFHVVTPSGSILYIQPEKYGGYTVSFQYVPNHTNGSGCSCNDNPSDINSIRDMLSLEDAGKAFAFKLRVGSYYKSWEHFAKGHWTELTEYHNNR